MFRLLTVSVFAFALAGSAIAQPKFSPRPELSLDWGAWVDVELGMTLEEADSAAKGATGRAFVRTGMGRYEIRYERSGAEIIEEISTDAQSGRVNSYGLKATKELDCEELSERLTDELGQPEIYSPAAISFGLYPDGSMTWKLDSPGKLVLALSGDHKPIRCNSLSVF